MKKSKLINIFLIISLSIFLIMVYLLLKDKTAFIDNKGYLLATLWQNDYITNIFKFLSFLCSAYFLIPVCIIFYFTLKNKKKVLMISINLILCLTLNQILKFIFTRNRPIGINLITENGYSFPSGHSMVSLAFYGLFIYMIYKSNLCKRYKLIGIVLLLFLILLIGLSRIYLGVHYTTDVIGGFSLSACYLILFIKYCYKKVVKS